MSHREIHAALDGHLKAMEGLPPVAWENVAFRPPMDGSAYLRTDFMPNSSDYGSLGDIGTVHEKGLYQVGVSAPSGEGSGGAEALADRIISHFTRKTLGALRTTLPYRGQARPGEGRMFIAVTVPYQLERFT